MVLWIVIRIPVFCNVSVKQIKLSVSYNTLIASYSSLNNRLKYIKQNDYGRFETTAGFIRFTIGTGY